MSDFQIPPKAAARLAAQEDVTDKPTVVEGREPHGAATDPPPDADIDSVFGPPTVGCVFCGEQVDPNSRRTWRKVEGFERHRDAGGTNAIALRHQLDVWACDPCISKQKTGLAPGQGTLT